VAEACVVLDGRIFETPGFSGASQVQSAPIVRNGVQRGVVKVGYSEERPLHREGPFLHQERKLIDTVAHEVGLLAERLEVQDRLGHLEGQLRHADRLATIGQLGAGVAHELNEPLANILGFAQLARKAPGIPEEAARDLDRVISATLHARDFVRRLLSFARGASTAPTSIDLDDLIDEVLALYESRLTHARVTVERSRSADEPRIDATPSLVQQVLVNLIVNAVQAMPEGGTLRIETDVRDAWVCVTVEDTGHGMSASVRRQIFRPFFTTKGPDEGTGLGLSVVHDIVSAHGGKIEVQSVPDVGTRFPLHILYYSDRKA